MPRADPAAVRHQIELRLAALRARSYAELVARPAYATERVPFGPRAFELTSYCDREPGAVRVVVQALPDDAGLVWTEAQAGGFRRLASGAEAPVAERELCEFT